jgi:hypothetical protein
MAKLSEVDIMEMVSRGPAEIAAETAISEAISATVVALTKAIVLVLQSDGRDRFARAERLSKLATSLQRQGSSRVADLQPDDDDGIGGIYNGGHIPIRPAFNDQADLMRQLTMQLAPMHAATARTHLATELRELTEAKENMHVDDRAAVDVRIKVILQQLKGDDANGNDPVVPANLLRGHPVGEPGRGDDDAELREAVAVGGGGDAVVARACGAAEVGPQAMGEPLRFPRPE